MGRHPLFIDEGVIGIIAEKLRALASGNEAFFEVINDLWRAPIVFVGEVALKWDLLPLTARLRTPMVQIPAPNAQRNEIPFCDQNA